MSCPWADILCLQSPRSTRRPKATLMAGVLAVSTRRARTPTRCSRAAREHLTPLHPLDTAALAAQVGRLGAGDAPACPRPPPSSRVGSPRIPRSRACARGRPPVRPPPRLARSVGPARAPAPSSPSSSAGTCGASTTACAS
jgi:hypothetical protein